MGLFNLFEKKGNRSDFDGITQKILMNIEQFFLVKGRGVVIVGTLKNNVDYGDDIVINNINYTIAGIETSSHTLVHSATAGMTVGLLINTEQISLFNQGDVVYI